MMIRKLSIDELGLSLLSKFNRYQETKDVWYEKDGQFLKKVDTFIDEWNDEKKAQVIQSLKGCVERGGSVIGAFSEGGFVGFANVEAERFGSHNQYVELPYIHVSNESRKSGIGKKLFEQCCQEARKLGAEKLYIAAHPSVESQAFYLSLGCKYATEINEEIFQKEPLDIQMEFFLS